MKALNEVVVNFYTFRRIVYSNSIIIAVVTTALLLLPNSSNSTTARNLDRGHIATTKVVIGTKLTGTITTVVTAAVLHL